MSLCYIGIDPGKTGAVAVLDVDLVAVRVIRPEYSARVYAETLREILNEFGPCVAALELTQGFPGQGMSSCHEYGRGAGWWEGALATLGMPCRLVSPNVWHKDVFDSRCAIKGKKRAAALKARSIEQARRQWPAIAICKSDDGIADALHIAHWCHMHTQPGQASEA